MGRRKKPRVFKPIEYEYEYAIIRLNPNNEQQSLITECCHAGIAINKWIHDIYLNPAKIKLHVERTPSFCCMVLHDAIDHPDNKYDGFPPDIKSFINHIGVGTFDNIVKMAASEHRQGKLGEPYFSRWLSLSQEGYYCTFINTRNNFPYINENTPEVVNNVHEFSNILHVNTQEFGDIPVMNKCVDILLKYMRDTRDKYIIYPQILVNYNTNEYYMRCVFAYVVDYGTISNHPNFYYGEYFKEADLFFSHFKTYYTFPHICL